MKEKKIYEISLISVLILIYIVLSFIFYWKYESVPVKSISHTHSQASGMQYPGSASQISTDNSQSTGLKNEPGDTNDTNSKPINKFAFEQNSPNQKLPVVINPPPEIPNESEVFTVVENNPSYPGGEYARMKFLQHNIKYPADAISKTIEGKVIINFIVEKDGTVSNVKVIQGIGGGCDEEAVRVARLMPKWNPGKQSGVPVRVLFNMPITFRLKMGGR